MIVTSILVGMVLVLGTWRSVVDAGRFPETLRPDSSILLNKPGNYLIYLIYRNGSGAATYIRPDISFTDSSGKGLFVNGYFGNRTRSRGTMGATAFMIFHINNPGVYYITVTTMGLQLQGGEQLGVGSDTNIPARRLGLGLFIGIGGTLGGVVVLVVTAVRRSRAKLMPVLRNPDLRPPPGPVVQPGQPRSPGWSSGDGPGQSERPAPP